MACQIPKFAISAPLTADSDQQRSPDADARTQVLTYTTTVVIISPGRNLDRNPSLHIHHLSPRSPLSQTCRSIEIDRLDDHIDAPNAISESLNPWFPFHTRYKVSFSSPLPKCCLARKFLGGQVAEKCYSRHLACREQVPRQGSHPLLGAELGVVVHHLPSLVLLLLARLSGGGGVLGDSRLDACLGHPDEVVDVVGLGDRATHGAFR